MILIINDGLKLLSPDISKLIDLKSPLEIDSEYKSEISIKDDKSHLLKLNVIQRDDNYFFILSFLSNIKLVSPTLFKNKFSIDFYTLPLSKEGIRDFRSIIVKIDSFFITISIDTQNGFSADFDQIKKNELTLIFKNTAKFNLTIEKYDCLEEFYKKSNAKIKLPPSNLSGLGIIYDFLKNRGNDIRFSELKSLLKFDDIYLILKNWENNKRGIEFHKHLDEIEGFLHKIVINNINYIFHFDNTVPVDLKDSFSVIRMRNGNVSSENKRVYIDFFSKEGESQLVEIYKKIFNINSKGLYLDPAYIYFSDEEMLEKSVVKSGEGLNQYIDNIAAGFNKINGIIKKLNEKNTGEDFAFFSNVLSKSLNAFIYLDLLPEDIAEGLTLAEEIYKQGFINYGFFINEKMSLSKNNLDAFVLFLFVSVVFIDIEVLIESITKDEYIKNYFIALLEDRVSLRHIVDNALTDFIKEGRLPVNLYKIKNSPVGFFIGKSLFCSLLESRLFDSIITLPQGKWFSLKDGIIVDGGFSFSYKGEKGYYNLFQREDTIALYDNNRKQGISSKSFFIYSSIENSFKSQIVERININGTKAEINHAFSLKKSKGSIVINYTSKQKENIGRTFLFCCIIKEEIVDKIIVNDRKKIFKREKGASFIEFSHINKENSINIEIILESAFEKN